MAYEYSNGKWNYVGSDKPIKPKESSSSANNKPNASSPSGGGKSDKESGSGDKSKSKSILKGDLVLRVPQPTLNANETINLAGLGSHLSGLYYVEEVKNEFGNNGFTQTIVVSRDGVGEVVRKGGTEQTNKSLKKGNKTDSTRTSRKQVEK